MRTAWEIQKDGCHQLQVNFNHAGERITLSDKKTDFKSCGVDLSNRPATTLYASSPDIGLIDNLMGKKVYCTRIETFVSNKGLGTYVRYTDGGAQAKCGGSSQATKPGSTGSTNSVQ